MSMVCEHPIIQPPLVIYFMEGRSMGPSSGQAAEASHGVEVVAGYSVAGEGFVGGSGKEWVAWGPRWNPWGSTKTFFLKVDPLYSY